MATVEELLDRAEERIKASKNVDLWRVSDARVNSEELLSEVIGTTITTRDLGDEVSPSQQRRFDRMVARRVGGEPVAMILGKTEFRGMWLKVVKGVFVPRQSSEHLAAEAVKRLRGRRSPVAVDVATGTGPVALSIGKEVRAAKVWGVDISQKPLKIAKQNADVLGLGNVEFIRSDLLRALPRRLRGKVDLFTLHPPYVAHHELRELPKEIREFEPIESLTDRSDDGLSLVRRLGEEAPGWLGPRGWVLIEVSPNLSRKVKGILSSQGFSDLRSTKDSLGVTRVISGRYSG